MKVCGPLSFESFLHNFWFWHFEWLILIQIKLFKRFSNILLSTCIFCYVINFVPVTQEWRISLFWTTIVSALLLLFGLEDFRRVNIFLRCCFWLFFHSGSQGFLKGWLIALNFFFIVELEALQLDQIWADCVIFHLVRGDYDLFWELAQLWWLLNLFRYG